MGNTVLCCVLWFHHLQRDWVEKSQTAQGPANIPLRRCEQSGGVCHPPSQTPKQNHVGPPFAPNPNPPPHSQPILLSCAQPQTRLPQTLAQDICFLGGCATAALQKRLRHHVGAFPKNPLFPPKLSSHMAPHGAQGHQPRNGTVQSPPAPGKGQYL